MMEINLSNRWKCVGATRTRGYAFLDERMLDTMALAAVLDTCRTEREWINTISRLNGFYAVVTRRDEFLLAAVDRLRSIPLFFGSSDKSLSMSDDAYCVHQALGNGQIDELSTAEFLLTGYVTGQHTLYSRIKQLRPGETITVPQDSVNSPEYYRYYEFYHRDYCLDEREKLFERLQEVHYRAFQRLIASTGGAPIVIPLSGGYDSRLIAMSLKEAGVRDVVCYSYGVPGNWESRISAELARYLGFSWVFVPYSPTIWRERASSPEFKNYFHKAGNFTSVPHVQDWLAVSELRRRDKISIDSIFVPGHSGDFLAGSHIPKWFAQKRTISRREFFDAIYRSHYSLWDWPKHEVEQLKLQLDRKVESIVGAFEQCSVAEAANRFELWDWQERQAKFICNSVSVYEYFEYDWRLPLFDNEVMDFWAQIPFEWRLRRKLYFEFVEQYQKLPITRPNQDRGLLGRTTVAAIEGLSLYPLAKATQRLLRRIFWYQEYENHFLAWYALIDRQDFKKLYTGKETLHSFLAKQYIMELQLSHYER
jgi:asparagine synthase (glutamine-hydrolysing)